MRFIPVEPDIATVFNRISEGDYDLQPDFQRGEVWPLSKQQRLIDSILRGWVVPPILLIKSGDHSLQQVLDGQQRLVSIRDFKKNKFPVDGRVEPVDQRMQVLHGLYYADLPPDVAKRFDRTPLRLYEITDYTPQEPAEIFFRLNQPTALTSAEKRNAFFGPVRDQIRKAVEAFEDIGDSRERLGFSNSRMAYDDVFARLACVLEMGRLDRKVTASAVTEMYRRSEPLRQTVLKRIYHAIKMLNMVLSGLSNVDIENAGKLNKATLFSWLLFFSRLENSDSTRVLSFFGRFEGLRARVSRAGVGFVADPVTSSLLSSFNDRATSRVSDVSSVQIRDFVLWCTWYEFGYADPKVSREHSDLGSFQAFFYQRAQKGEDESMDAIILDFVQLYNLSSEIP